MFDSQGMSTEMHARISVDYPTRVDDFIYITLGVHEGTLHVRFEDKVRLYPGSEGVGLSRFAGQKVLWPVVVFEHESECDFVELVGIHRRGAHGGAQRFAMYAKRLGLPSEIAETIWMMSLVET